MEFWDTFWATMWGALAGAVVAAFAAWLFSLDLRRREREDRKQEAEQERLDRQAERSDERDHQRSAWEAEHIARSREREEQRAYEYGLRMRRLWEDMLVRLTKDGSLGGSGAEVENKREIVAILMALAVSGRGADAQFHAAFRPRVSQWTAHQRSEDLHRLTTILYGWLNGTLPLTDAVSGLTDESEWETWLL